MRHTCLALGLLINVVTCNGGGSSARSGGGAAAGQASAGSSDPGGSGGAGGEQAGTSGSAGAMGGGPTAIIVSSTGLAGVAGSAGRSAEGTGSAAGTSAAGAGATGNNCGVVYASPTTPDLLLVIDRSASMDYSLADDKLCRPDAGTTCKNRWSTLASALRTAITDTPNAHWGLKFFASGPSLGAPPGGSCLVNDRVEVPIGADSGPMILSLIEATMLGGNTPTRAAIQASVSYLKTIDDQNSKFILLATDGAPNCSASRPSSESDLEATVEAIRNAGFPVYVVGVGPLDEAVHMTYTQAFGPGHYFRATSPEELTRALVGFAASSSDCTFKLTAAPSAPDKVTVTLGQTVIPRNVVNGWDFAGDTRIIELHGESCAALPSKTTTLKVQINCPGTP